MGELFSAIIAILLLSVSCFLLYYLSKALIQASRHIWSPHRNTFRYKKCQRQISKADTLMNEGRFNEAVIETKKGIVLDILPNEESISKIREHHQNLLSRLLVIGEQLGCRINNLPDVEHLMIQRSELLLLLLKAERSYSDFKTKRKDAPEWSKKDYLNKITQVKSELAANKKHLVDALETLFKGLQEGGKPSADVTYH